MICPVCKESTTTINSTYLLNLINSSTYHCPNCGIFFRDPLPGKETVILYYTSRYFRYPDNIEKEMARIQGSFIIHNLEKESITPQEINYLEFGAGRGWVLSYLQKSGIKSALGLEPDTASTQWSKENLKVDIRTGVLDESQIVQIKTDFPETNMVSVIHVLEHLHNPEEILALLKKNVKKHYLFVEVPDAEYEGPIMKIDIFPWSSMGQHFWSFSEKSLRLILKKQGYRILALEHPGNPHFWDKSLENIVLWKEYFTIQQTRFEQGNFGLSNIIYTDVNLLLKLGITKIKNLGKPKYTRLDLPVIRILAVSE